MLRYWILLALCPLLGACEINRNEPQTITTVADARTRPAVFVDNGPAGDSPGDMWVFDQPLLNEQGEPIGNNAGFCIRTMIGEPFQCQWTLTMTQGSIQVAGREAEQGTSLLAIVGGTGEYQDIRGEMTSLNRGNGTFLQALRFSRSTQ